MLHELIEEYGQEGFLEIEDRVNATISPKAAVIATGGSVVYCQNAMNHLNDIAMICYLKLSYECIEDRLGDLHERGVVLKEGQTLKNLYDERVPLYEKYANMTVDCENKNIREIVMEIAKRVK
jgi:shikimate kinase